MSQKTSGRASTLLIGLATLAAGLTGGLTFTALSIPLPWVLGSFSATGLLSLFGVRLALPSSWRGYAMVIVGTMLGAGFDPETVKAIPGWWPSLLIMILLSIAFFFFAFLVLQTWAKMTPATAFLAAVPGGLSVVSVLAETYGADPRRVVLCHSARLVALLVTMPILIHLLGDYDLAGASRPGSLPPIDGSPLDLLLLLGCAIAGYFLGRVMKVPSGLLLIPLILSAFVLSLGVVEAHVPAQISIVAQIIIGANVGVRFVGYRLRDILSDGWMSAIIGVVLSFSTFLAALAASELTGIDAAPLLLSFLPGGAPEMGVVAVALHIAPAMVACHHLVRVALMVALIPFGLKHLAKPGKSD
ncbi:membrane AbrB-like protein [Rhodopseudomonas julia]|uniref:Membrane AbrB-like protein n=1 Tax=Rhodopseudomonas julia TaxID=200617 RepID=A0ABU0CCS8_9BRAD|nr:AbrB family transcriptional regulator [Rhodopseudomonas julia]MDQ0327440.1 membrane AbrB-like protein [Rhodopseudomonas julia]